MKKTINTPAAPAAVGPYSQAVEVGNTLYISGQVPVNPATGMIETTDVAQQTKQVFQNIQVILNEAGYQLSDVVKTTLLLTDMDNFATVNTVYATYFEGDYPARVAFAVKALPLGALVEIESIAIKTDTKHTT